ncbi:nitroreductase family protein [Vibrio splendidus]
MCIKKKIKSLVPQNILKKRIELLTFFRVNKLFFEDAKYFISHSGVLTNKNSSRLAKIIKNYHKIEKGLTLHPRRYHFGEAVISVLLSDIKQAVHDENGKDEELVECANAINALMAYIQCHAEMNTEFIQSLKSDVDSLSCDIECKQKDQAENLPNAISLHSEVSCKFQEEDINFYDRIIMSRKSVRRFSNQNVETAALESAINLALQSPSACNRQPWFVTHLGNKADVDKALAIQKGNISLAENINELLIVWMDVNRALSPEERGQHLFDGGLFSMNLANALHIRGINSCFLNWAKERKDDDILREYVQVPVNYKPVTFLAIGYADKESIVCRSARKSLKNSFFTMNKKNN